MPSTIEALEARIAPATLFIGKPGVSNDPHDAEYSDTPSAASKLGFIKMQGAVDPISTAVGNTDANTYYLLLKGGDSVDLFNSTQPIQGFIQVKSGAVIAFFHDVNGNNEFDRGELTGFAISDGANVVFKDSLQGDIVENLSKDGKTISMDTLSTGSGVRSLSFRAGDVAGNVLAGSNLLGGSFNAVDGIFAGTAANGKTFDFFPSLVSGNGTIATLVPAPGKAGISISNLIVDRVGIVQTMPQIINHPVGSIQAGDGGAGGVGGNISNIQVVGDTDGFNVLAGKGGDGNTILGRVNGGAGGTINGLYISGLSDIGYAGKSVRAQPGHDQCGCGWRVAGWHGRPGRLGHEHLCGLPQVVRKRAAEEQRLFAR